MIDTSTLMPVDAVSSPPGYNHGIQGEGTRPPTSISFGISQTSTATSVAIPRTLRVFIFSAIFLAASFCIASVQATLIGDTFTGTGTTLTPTTATIGTGVEFDGISGFIDFDFDANTLTMTENSNTPISWGLYGSFVFSDFDSVITGLSIQSNSGFSGSMVSGGFSFTSSSLTFDFDSGNATAGAVIVFDIATQSVSEPGTVAVFGLGLAGLGFMRRRRAA